MHKNYVIHNPLHPRPLLLLRAKKNNTFENPSSKRRTSPYPPLISSIRGKLSQTVHDFAPLSFSVFGSIRSFQHYATIPASIYHRFPLDRGVDCVFPLDVSSNIRPDAVWTLDVYVDFRDRQRYPMVDCKLENRSSVRVVSILRGRFALFFDSPRRFSGLDFDVSVVRPLQPTNTGKKNQ